ncbi:MAG: hypothetical protein LAT67_09275 [Balneolales bacterium]|nr:hypothetical protein [Balneolales bacterium]
MAFRLIDWVPLILYGIFLVILVLRNRKDGNNETQTEAQFLLSGRKLSLPGLVATLVATWYGGILGVGEFTYLAGISQWLLFGFPFYVFAIIYAFTIAGKIQKGLDLTIPEALGRVYGKSAKISGAAGIAILVSPAPYILMLGVLAEFVLGTGSPIWPMLGVTFFSVIYVSSGGFGAVVRTDWLQLFLMYTGFVVLIAFAWSGYGSPLEMFRNLPESHTDITGGHHISYILVWFFIAMWTFVDPGFHQRCAASRSPETARKGILISVGFWAVFDLLTLTAGLYAFSILGDKLLNPVAAYPELAAVILPAGLLGLFIAGLVATIMSTLDSYLFLSGQTIGRDVIADWFPDMSRIALTRTGILAGTLIALAMIGFFPSVISLWYVAGSLVIPALLLPVLGLYLPVFAIKPKFVTYSILGAFSASLIWLILGIFHSEDIFSYAYRGVEPFYPGLMVSAAFWILSKGKSGIGTSK